MADNFPRVSVIIPSLDGYRNGNVPKLLEDVKKQDFNDVEIIVIKGVSPGSLARNKGAEKARGEYLVFIDDDVRIADKKLLSNLIETFSEDSKIGLVGASMLVPEDANLFQRRVVKECSFAYSTMIDKTTDSDLVCHACQAIPRKLYLEIGKEDKRLLRGEDAEFHNRMREAGYRIVLAANTGVYHSPDKNPLVLIKGRFKSGFLGARDQVYYPQLIYEYGRGYGEEFKKQYSFLFRVLRFIFDRLIFSIVSLRFIRFISYISYGIGRVAGLLIFGFKKYLLGEQH